MRAPGCPQRRNQDHIAAECLAAPRRAIYDEVESAPVIWDRGYARRGGPRQPLLGDHPPFGGDGFPRDVNPCSLEYGSTPGRRRRDGRPAGPPRLGSLAHHVHCNGSEGVAGERLAYPTAGVVCPRPWGWLACKIATTLRTSCLGCHTLNLALRKSSQSIASSIVEEAADEEKKN